MGEPVRRVLLAKVFECGVQHRYCIGVINAPGSGKRAVQLKAVSSLRFATADQTPAEDRTAGRIADRLAIAKLSTNNH